MSLQLRIATLFLVLLHPRNSPSVIALELNIFLLTFMGLFGFFSPPSQHMWLFSVVNLPEVLRRPGLTRLWIKGAYSKKFFMSRTWVTCSTDVCEITCTKGNIGMVSHTSLWASVWSTFSSFLFLQAFLWGHASSTDPNRSFTIYKISGTHLRCQEMKSVITTWKYRKRHKTFTGSKKSQGYSGIASYMRVTAPSSFVSDSHIQLFCFLEQLLTSFDVCHVTIPFYISFLFSYILTFVSWPHTVHVYCTVKQSSQTLKKISFSFNSACGNGRFICTAHCLNSHWIKFTK